MGKIQKLPESLIRLIAAGEVIERPASVVKELVENSLDAGATSVTIDLIAAGRTRIRVSDNGEGMSREDATLALDRHATSKLQTFDDLQEISTFGFRGEALPSIAAISRLELTTRTRDSEEGHSLTLEGGALKSSKAAGIPPGTTINVEDLFFNTPARSKFLKRDSTERSHVLRTLQEIALAHPAVRFEVIMDGKPILSLAPTRELGERISDLWGLSVAEQLVPVQVTKGPCTVRGFVNAIPAHHPTKAYQVLFVNQRPVQQRMINHAIYEAYREWLPVGRHPVYCLFVDLDPTLVDVNVHPAKREVRISEERAVYDLIYTELRSLLQGKQNAPEYTSMPDQQKSGIPSWGSPNRYASSPTVHESAAALLLQTPTAAAGDLFQASASPIPLVEWADMRYLGQFQKVYLLFDQGEELILVDQHAAAERVLYERLLTQVSMEDVSRQILLAPLLWDVAPDQAETVRSFLPDLERMGFILEEFGPSSFALKEWPMVLPETKQAKRFLEEVLDAFQNEKPTSRTEIQHQIAARAACRAAVMANDKMAPQEVTRLLEDLSACDRPMTCPHGRPTHIRLTLAELHRRFRRT